MLQSLYMLWLGISLVVGIVLGLVICVILLRWMNTANSKKADDQFDRLMSHHDENLRWARANNSIQSGQLDALKTIAEAQHFRLLHDSNEQRAKSEKCKRR